MDTTRIDRNRWCVLLADSDWSAFCETLYVEVEQENWEHMCNTLREAADMGLYQEDWTAHGSALESRATNSAGGTHFDEHLKGQVKTHRTLDRKDLCEVWAASPTDAVDDVQRDN